MAARLLDPRSRRLRTRARSRTESDAVNANEDLLTVEEVAHRLGVGPVTIYRWCREGRLPGLKLGKVWRVRQGALDEFLRRNERGQTLVSRLNTFYTVPDHVMGTASDARAMRRLDAAFFQIAEARGGVLIKGYAGESASLDELRASLTRGGLDVAALEAAGRFHFARELEPGLQRADVIQALLTTAAAVGRSVWVSFDWAKHADLDVVLRQQQGLARLVDEARLVVQTVLLQEIVDTWPPSDQRRLQQVHRSMVSIADTWLTLTRVNSFAPDHLQYA